MALIAIPLGWLTDRSKRTRLMMILSCGPVRMSRPRVLIQVR